MKKEVKFVQIVLLLLMIVSITNAQKSWRMGVGVSAGLATKNVYGVVLAADARFQKGIAENTSFIFTTGFTHFLDNNKTVNAFSYVPVKLGLKSFANKHLYFAGEVGAGLGVTKGAGSSFVWSPSVGYSFKSLDVAVKYEDFTSFETTKHIALRFAYGFKL
ncbi:MAG: hypothetical protein ACOVNY_02460 [Chitinophagaceae bacterium]